MHTTTLESTSALKHFRCTQEGMQEQINSALSLALEKILDNSELDNALREVGSVRDESLPSNTINKSVFPFTKYLSDAIRYSLIKTWYRNRHPEPHTVMFLD